MCLNSHQNSDGRTGIDRNYAATTESSDTTTVTATTTTALAPRITNVDPDKGKTGTTVSITSLQGTNFRTGATVSLKKSGTTINATEVSFGSADPADV